MSDHQHEGQEPAVDVDFGVTQVVDGNWGVHTIIKKNLFAAREN